MTMHQYSNSKQRHAAAASRPSNLLGNPTATASRGGGDNESLRTPPNSRVVLMKRATTNGRRREQDEDFSSSGGRGDADSFGQSRKYADRMQLPGSIKINVHAEDEFPPLMSPTSSAVSSPQKTQSKHFTERRQKTSEIVRAGGRGILNMLKRDGLLNDSVVTKNDNKHVASAYGLSSGLGRGGGDNNRQNRMLEEKVFSSIAAAAAGYGTNYDQSMLNNGRSTDYYANNAYGVVKDQLQPRLSANVSRKSSASRAPPYNTTSSGIDDEEEEAALHDLDESERITEKLSTAQSRIKQQINAKFEYEKQQQQQQQQLHAAKSFMPEVKDGNNVAGVIKLTKPLLHARESKSRMPPQQNRRIVNTSALQTLADLTLKDNYLPKPQCLINHNLDWQEQTQKLLLREFLDEQNELFTVIGVCGPQSSGKSTILSCLGIQSMGNFQLFDHDAAEIVAPTKRQTSSVNVYINAKQRVILLDSPGVLSTQLLAELMNRPTRPPPLFNGDKLNNVSGVHVYLEHQAEVYAYQLAAFLFAVSHVVLFCTDLWPPEHFYTSVMDFLHKSCIMKPSVLNLDLQNPLCGVVNVEEMLAMQRMEMRQRRMVEKAEFRSSYGRPTTTTGGGGRGEKRFGESLRRSVLKEAIADHWPNLYFVVNKASDAVEGEENGSKRKNIGLKLCSVPDDRVRLESALKSLVSASTPLGRATRLTDKLRITGGGAVRSDEEKWPKLALEDCQLFVVPFVGAAKKLSKKKLSNSLAPVLPLAQESVVAESNYFSFADRNETRRVVGVYNSISSEDFGDKEGEEEYNPALRFIFDDNLTLPFYNAKIESLPKTPTPTPPAAPLVTKNRAGILTGVKLPSSDRSNFGGGGGGGGGRNTPSFDRFRNIRSVQKWQAGNYTSPSYYRRPRAGLVSRAPSSHVCRHAHYRGGGVEQSFYTDLSNVERFIIEKQPKLEQSKDAKTISNAAKSSSSSGIVTWKDILSNKQAYDTIAKLRRTCFNAPSLPITPGMRMSEKQWLRYASAMWSHIKSDSTILNYARAINMASSSSSSTAAAGT